MAIPDHVYRIIEDSGALSGDPFISAEQVREYFTTQNMTAMFGQDGAADWSQDELDDAARWMIDSGLHMDLYLTPAEAAALTGTSESGWRNKAASGSIPGAVKKGKQWLLPRAALAGERPTRGGQSARGE
ncbi:MAG: DNA-binding protein [Chloroflexi bacterium CFX6]|nr:DNA-binding protein [Chloroflexi bacterium CFX6]